MSASIRDIINLIATRQRAPSANAVHFQGLVGPQKHSRAQESQNSKIINLEETVRVEGEIGE